jgi:N-methylhydantoinase B
MAALIEGLAIDAITFQVIQSRLAGIVREMQENIFRTGYSTIVRESQDASCMLLDADGAVVGEHAILPLHVAALPEVVRATRAAFGDDIHPGDAFITNHPYIAGVTHSQDMALITPVFSGNTLLAFCGSIAHKSDLGGVVPGTGYASARELFQEGIQYPPIRFVRRGEVVRDVEAILRANSRTPDLILGDLRGQLGCARLGERRVRETVERYGASVVRAAFAHAQRVTEMRVRSEIARWPDGTHEAVAFVDNDGVVLDRRLRYHVRIEKRGDRILFDFSGSDDQAAGPVNIRPSLARGCCYYALIATIDPTLANNGGLARVVETRFRRGSLLDPVFPAPTNTYMASTIACTEAALEALSAFVPERACAGNGGVGGSMIAGRRPDGTAFVQYELIASAYGGNRRADGLSGTDVLLANTRSASIEIVETEYPTRVRRFELIPGSGGAGEHRGGLAPRREYEILTGEAQLTLRGGRHERGAKGREGGKDGRVGSCIVNPGTPAERAFPSRFSGVVLTRGDVVRLEKAGGGGMGDPRLRPFDRVLTDVLDGYVSVAEATETYGADPERLHAALEAWDGGNVYGQSTIQTPRASDRRGMRVGGGRIARERSAGADDVAAGSHRQRPG